MVEGWVCGAGGCQLRAEEISGVPERLFKKYTGLRVCRTEFQRHGTVWDSVEAKLHLYVPSIQSWNCGVLLLMSVLYHGVVLPVSRPCCVLLLMSVPFCGVFLPVSWPSCCVLPGRGWLPAYHVHRGPQWHRLRYLWRLPGLHDKRDGGHRYCRAGHAVLQDPGWWQGQYRTRRCWMSLSR